MDPFASATEIAAATRAGEVRVAEVAESVLGRIAERNAAVGAWAHLEADGVRERAAELDAADVRGPLHGVPLAVKDVFLTRDLPTGHGVARWAGHRAGHDAAVVETLRCAGALLLGKTVTTEFAATLRGAATRNPHDPDRTPGGSSSGSAAAVADGQATLALGTQTGGSTIRPASYCGTWALKPTWGAVSTEGFKTGTPTCDTVGLFARSAADLGLLADVLDLDPPISPLPRDPGALRVLLCRTPWWDTTGPGTREALATAAVRLRAAGAQVVELDLPDPFGDLLEALVVIVRRETQATFRNELAADPDGLHGEFRARAEGREVRPAPDLRAAYGLAERCRAAFDDLTDGFDIVLTPSAADEAPLGLDHTGPAALNAAWTLLHVPVVNVPGLTGPHGLPVGLSVVGRRFEDRLTLAAATVLGQLLAGRRG